jgi:catalase
MLQFRIFSYAAAHRYRLGVNYESLPVNGPVEDHRYNEPPLPVAGDADRYDHRVGNDDYSESGALFRSMSADQKRQLFDNTAAAMQGVPETIQRRQIGHFTKADSAYGQGVAERLGLMPKLQAAE